MGWRLAHQLKRFMNDLDAMWLDFLSRPFPKGMGGAEVKGVCLSSLDSAAAGCKSSFVKNGYGPLDLNRFMALQNSVSQLELISSSLSDEALDYFVQLQQLCRLVLKEAHMA